MSDRVNTPGMQTKPVVGCCEIVLERMTQDARGTPWALPRVQK